MRFVAVDWSGSLSSGGSEIWVAAVEDGVLVDLYGRLTRPQAVEALCDWKASGIDMVVGLDFAFSMPAWFVRQCGCGSAPEFWSVVDREGEGWLTDCLPPFWGKPGKKRDAAVQHRRTELAVDGAPKSVFQIGGAGAVGTGSIRGMPFLARLQAAGFTVWPFEAPTATTVVEIYPRLLTGIGPKRQPGWCRAYLDVIDWPAAPDQRAVAAATEDSFDASVSALRMWQARGELAQLKASTEEGDILEGRIWAPSIAITPVQVGAWERLGGLQSGPKVRLAVTEAPTVPRMKGDGLCGCGCGASVRQRYLPGHDAKHKSRLLREARAGSDEAVANLTRLGWIRFLTRQ